MKRVNIRPWTMVSSTILVAVVTALASGQPQATLHTLMPAPAQIAIDQGELRIDSVFTVTFTGHRDARLEGAATRFVQRLGLLTGIPLGGSPGGGPSLQIDCRAGADEIPQAIEDESYTLTVTPSGAQLSAATPYGVLRGLETMLQLVQPSPAGFTLPAVRIRDNPRFPWRGLLLDVCRHWLPLDVVLRTLDGMAAVKMNVLHWHLSEDQGFRVESKAFPKLHEMGSDGKYFTQDQVRMVVRYAADRGIRVVPEFDMPGHSTSWFVGYPELASLPRAYAIERGYGVMNPTMDPTRESTYEFLDAFIGEMAGLFPDPYFHIGGDEVTGKQWDSSAAITAFKVKQGMQTNHDLQMYFNKRISAIVEKHGKKMVGWDEIMHPDLPKTIVVQSWRGQKSLAEGATQGYAGILSFGYYLDHMQSAARHYGVDPLAAEAASLPPDAQRRILGGEACMWAELITPENVDNRIWPRAAVVAERLWSPASVTDTLDMYRRMAAVSRHLTLLGSRHETQRAVMLQRAAGTGQIGPLETLVSVLEPTKDYSRHVGRRYTMFTPLNRLVDIASPESERARRFNLLLSAFLADRSRQGARDTLILWLREWRDNHARVKPLLEGSSLLAEVLPLSEALAAASDLALHVLGAGGTIPSSAGSGSPAEIIDRALRPQADLLIMVVPGIQKLISVWQPPKSPPEESRLFQNFPNPFNGTTWIPYMIPRRAQVQIALYNILGQNVTDVVNAIREPNVYAQEFDAKGLASGVYFCRMTVEGSEQAQKMVMVK